MCNFIDICPQQIGNIEQNCVDARELWQKLESKRQFGNWIQDRLEDFDEEVDYVCVFNKIVKNPSEGGRPEKNFILTLDTAKHIAMLERNSAGKQIRQYFIEIERRFIKNIEEKVQKLTEQRHSPFRSTQQTFSKIQHFHGKPILNILGKTKKSEVRILSFGYNKAIAICNNFKDIQKFVDDIEDGVIGDLPLQEEFSLDI